MPDLLNKTIIILESIRIGFSYMYARVKSYLKINKIYNFEDWVIDRFGKMSIEVENLFKLIEIKILCLKNNLEEIKFGKKGIIFKFFQNKPLYPEKILDIGLSKNSKFTIRSDQKLFYNLNEISKISKFELIKEIIETYF